MSTVVDLRTMSTEVDARLSCVRPPEAPPGRGAGAPEAVAMPGPTPQARRAPPGKPGKGPWMAFAATLSRSSWRRDARDWGRLPETALGVHEHLCEARGERGGGGGCRGAPGRGGEG